MFAAQDRWQLKYLEICKADGNPLATTFAWLHLKKNKSLAQFDSCKKSSLDQFEDSKSPGKMKFFDEISDCQGLRQLHTKNEPVFGTYIINEKTDHSEAASEHPLGQ